MSATIDRPAPHHGISPSGPRREQSRSLAEVGGIERAKTLCLGNHASHVLGLPEYEGRALLVQLRDHATQAAFVYTHRWQSGDLVLWDNRCLLHRALAHERMGLHRRVLHRTAVKGSVAY